TWSGKGAAACTNCEPGTISTVGSSACTQCPAGSIADRAGLSACTKCPPGSFANKKGSKECTKCPAGYFSSTLNSIECTPSPAGYFINGVGSTSYNPCPVGTWSGLGSNREGTSSCTMCPPGSVAEEPGSTRCSLCRVGQYAPSPGSDKCFDCFPGYFTNKTGSSTCTPCPPGTRSSIQRATECIQCNLENNLSYRSGMSICDECPEFAPTLTKYKCYDRVNTECSSKDGISKTCRYSIDLNVWSYGVAYADGPGRDFLFYTFSKTVDIKKFLLMAKSNARSSAENLNFRCLPSGKEKHFPTFRRYNNFECANAQAMEVTPKPYHKVIIIELAFFYKE
uniref:Ephrin_rec_like domain-containing protein n=1 Tax=Macrostomum lignano TaxID=282301 RepID=A0A1I8JM00_9PLAT